MYCFKFPKKTSKELDSLVAKFLWSWGEEKRKIYWRSWELLTASKNEGGLGCREFKAVNEALLAKTAWRLINSPNELRAKVLKVIYFHKPF